MSRPRKTQVVPDRPAPGWIRALDSRTGLARDMAGRFDEIAADLGGADRLSYMERSLVERALWTEYWLAQQEKALASGADFDAGKYVQAANGLQGLFNRLGIARRPRDLGDLSAYIAAREREAAQ